MQIDKGEVIQRLTFEGILDAKGKIISEEKFKDIMFAVLLSFIAHNKILFNWNRDLKDNKKSLKEKSSKIKSYFSLPFHFLGLGNKTIFVADKNPRDKFLREEITETIITCSQDIDMIRRVSDLWEITDEIIKKSHSCQADSKNFCIKNCKESFENQLAEKHEKLLKALDIKSYFVLGLKAKTIKSFIDEDDIIEDLEDTRCKRCFCYFDEHDRFCSNCGLELEKKKIRESNDREKMFNYLLAIYLSKKNKILDYEANLHFHKGTRETDVLLKKDKKRILLEITTQVNIAREYLIEKAISLLIMQAILPKDYESYVIFWSLDKNNDSKDNIEDVLEMFGERRFFLVKSSLQKDILKNPTVGIPQEDLDLLRGEFENMLKYMVEKTKILLN